MYLDGWPPTSDIFIIFQHVGCRLYWSDDSYKTANEECGHSGNRWPFSYTGKVNLVYHQSILCSKSVSFESSSDRSNRESTLPWKLTFGGDQHFHSTPLFTLDSDLLSCSVLSRITFQLPNYCSCPLSNADGGNHNLTFHNQARLLWRNFQGSSFVSRKTF